MNPKLAVCIRTFSGVWNGKKYDRVQFLKDNMKSLLASITIPVKIIVVDDFSTMPEQLEYLKRLMKQGLIHQLVLKDKHMGRKHSFALLRYHGYKSGAPFVYICDDDHSYRKGWDKKMVDAYKVLQDNWEGKPIGELSGFTREGWDYDSTHRFGRFEFGRRQGWLGCRFMVSRNVLEDTGTWDWLEPTVDPPRAWDDKWIDDGSYQFLLQEKYGYEWAFVLQERPSLIDHMGSFGVHAKPTGLWVRGVK